MKWLAWKLLGSRPEFTVIRVKSWVPFFDAFEISWPTVLVGVRGGGRQTVSRIWNEQ